MFDRPILEPFDMDMVNPDMPKDVFTCKAWSRLGEGHACVYTPGEGARALRRPRLYTLGESSIDAWQRQRMRTLVQTCDVQDVGKTTASREKDIEMNGGVLTWQARAEMRPRGCPKCAWKLVGCAPSCWRGRRVSPNRLQPT